LSYPDGDAGAWWKPGARTKAAVRSALDLLFPPQSLDRGTASLSIGLEAGAWSRIHFIDGPLCDGCGQPLAMITASVSRTFTVDSGRQIQNP
jgi:hypothetical protein